MPTVVKCPNPQCGQHLSVGDEQHGQAVMCPKCRRPLRLSATDDGASMLSLRPTMGAVPKKVGKYEVQRELGSGAFGAVYLARDPDLNRPVAVKVPQKAVLGGTKGQERFLREARAAANLKHPHIVPVYDFGRDGGSPYLCMAYLERGTLQDRLEQGPLPPRQAALLALRLAEALAYAHAQGVAHRDVKPANVLLDGAGEPHLADFGLAHLRDASVRMTRAGAVMGTLAYMAPEVAVGQAGDGPDGLAKVDQYSLGAVLYEMLTGKLPFEGHPAALVHLAGEDPRQPPRAHNPAVPPELERICLKALAIEPTKRHEDCQALAAVLRYWLQALPEKDAIRRSVSATEDDGALGAPERKGTGGRKRQIAIALVLVLLAAVPLGYLYGGVLIRVVTNKGVLVIEADDSNVEVTVKLDTVVVHDRVKDRRFVLTAGVYDVEVHEEADGGVRFATKKFAITRGGKETFHARLEAKHSHKTTGSVSDPERPAAEWVLRVTGKAPVPEERLVKAAKAQLRQAYMAEFASDKPEEKKVLAKKMLERSRTDAAKQADVRLALLELAGESAAEGWDYKLALETCAEIDKLFLVDPWRVKSDMLEKAAHVLPTPVQAEFEAFIELALCTGYEALRADCYEAAKSMARVAKLAALKSGAAHFLYQAEFLHEDQERASKAYGRVKDSLTTVQTRHDDLRANADAGRFLCLVKNDWDRGLPLLINGDDRDLKALAELEYKKPAAHKEQLALGHLWWEAAARRDRADGLHYQARARHWYLKALARCKPEEKATLARDLVPRIDSVPTRPISLRVQMTKMWGWHELVLSNDGITHSMSNPGNEVRINHLRFPAGEAFHKPNTGFSRLLPAAADFTTLCVEKEWRHDCGTMRFSFTPDAFKIEFLNATGNCPDGTCDIHVTLHAGGFTLSNRLSGMWDVAVYTWDGKLKGTPSEHWDRAVAAKPIDRRTMDRIDFRCSDRTPFGQRFVALTDKTPHDWFCLGASSVWEVPDGLYEIHFLADDMIRIFIDDKKVVDWDTFPGVGYNWDNLRRPTVRLAEGKHRIRLDFFQRDQPARLQFALRRVGDR